ncbi:hypothetical protein [Pseudomonas sp. NPDC089396]|uniref:hypothetical protein n=1 Tax=Pseudomonas sp. NPDC089396 TaxID=3364461 RepID=UPI003837DEC7
MSVPLLRFNEVHPVHLGITISRVEGDQVMNTPMNKLAPGEQARQAVRLERIRRGKAQKMEDDIKPPEMEEAAFADARDGTLWSRLLRDENWKLTLQIPEWLNLTDPRRGVDVVKVYKLLDAEQVLHEGEYTTDDKDKFPLQIGVDHATYNRWGDGPHDFVYDLNLVNGGPKRSLPLTLRFDRTPPYDAGLPVAFPDLLPILEGNIKIVVLNLPEYPDWAQGDRVAYYWLKLSEPPEDLGELEYVDFVEVDAVPKDLPVPEDYIRETGNGGIYAIYQLFDKAGNPSFPSVFTRVGVALGDLPANLLPPRVPLAPDAADNLIDVADALLGVEVEIDEFDNHDPDDEINITWGGTELGWERIGNRKFPLQIPVPHRVLREEYGNATTGNKPTNVSYALRRGTVPQGGDDIDILVNFEIIERDPGVDPIPEWPNPVNPRLPLPDVYGKGSSDANVLLPEHEGDDAELKVKLYSDIKVDDLIAFYWKNQHIMEIDYTITAADTPDDEISLTVPWKYIKEGGNGVVPVCYKVTRPMVPNPGISGNQDVDVDTITIKPDMADFERGPSAPPGWVNCDSLFADKGNPDPREPAVRIIVPDLTGYGLAAGSKVSMLWEAFQGADDTPLPGANKPEEITLGVEYPVTGFTWYVQPYVDHIEPIYVPGDAAGSALVTYAFQYQGRIVTSEPLYIIVGMYDNNGSCALPLRKK